MTTDQPGSGQPSWQPPQGDQPPTYGQPPAGPAYGQPPAGPAYGQAFPAAPAYAAYGQPGAYAGPELAGWGTRVGAYLVDILVMDIPLVIGYVVFLAAANSSSSGSGAAGGSLVYLLGSLVSFGLWIWNRGIKQGGTGQSVGKKALGIRLVKEADGQPLGVGMSLLRDIVHIVDGFFYLGYLWPLWDPKKQTFADKILSTLSIKG